MVKLVQKILHRSITLCILHRTLSTKDQQSQVIASYKTVDKFDYQIEPQQDITCSGFNNNPSSNLVKITPSHGGDEPSTVTEQQYDGISKHQQRAKKSSMHNHNHGTSIIPLGVNINDANLLQLLKDVAGNGTTALAEVRGPGAIPLAATIDLLEATHTDALPQVDFPCNRGYSITQMAGQYKKLLVHHYQMQGIS